MPRPLPHIPAEQIGRADHTRILELLRNDGNAAALRDAHRYLRAGSAIAADLVVRKQQRPANGQRQQYHQHQQDLPYTAFFAGVFSCAISTFLLS